MLKQAHNTKTAPTMPQNWQINKPEPVEHAFKPSHAPFGNQNDLNA